MKKLFLLLIALCALTVAQAQVVSAYTMQATQGTYTEITDGTVMDLTGLDLTTEGVLTGKAWYPSGIVSEETTAEGFPIGFDFIFNDMVCNQFVIGAHGYIALGKDEITNDPSWKQHIAIRETGADNIIGVMPNVMEGIWASETSEFSYKVVGEAPYRTLVVQFKDWAPCFGWDAEDVVSMNMQLRLNETSNTIDFVFGDFIYEGTWTKGTRFTLRGYYEDQVSLVEGEEEGMINWTYIAGDDQPSLGAGMITSGLTYTFTPPAECETPSAYLVLKRLVPKTSSFSLEWSNFTDADHALILLTSTPQLTENPVDGEYYAAGDSLGNAYVLTYTTDTIYNTEDYLTLEPATQYYLYGYLANSYCSNGPKYDNGICSSFTTMPAAPAAFEIVETDDETITINLTANDNNDNIIVVYNTELVRDNHGDYPPIGQLLGKYTAGDDIYGGGKVAYSGPAGENIVLTGFEHSKSYFFVAYSYNEIFNYSTETLSADAATTAHLPYTLDLDAAKTLDLPVGWTKNENGSFQIPRNLTNYVTEENPRLLWCNVSKPDVTNGVLNQLTSCPIVIDKANAVVKFDFTMYHKTSRFAISAYNEWNENDVFAVQVSTDGETFEDVLVYNSTNNPTFVYGEEDYSLVPCEADLAKYEGQTIWIRIHWHLYNNSSFGPGTLVLDNFRIEEVIIPATPEVKVEDVAHTSAKVTWRSEQENYEVAYAKTGEEFVTVVVEGASEYVLTELEAETEYQVKVRGIVEEGKYSAWSEVVTFTTTEWPECDAPTNLAVQYVEQLLVLTWEGTEDHLLWELRYREANSTSWIAIDSIESTTWVIEDLTEAGTYLWNVRAFCTAGRTTAWSAQGSFTVGAAIPVAPVIEASALSDAVYVSWAPVHGATSYKLYYGTQVLGEFEETAVNVQVVEAGTYCFTVTALNEMGESEHSNEACATVVLDPDLEAPAAPVVEARLENDQAVLTWNAVEGATYYSVYYNDELLGSTQYLEARIPLPEPGEYCFIVAAGNLAGESNSEPVCVTYGEGIDELTSVLNIYPNPVNDRLVIETEATMEEICIYDAFGRLMTKVNETTTIDVSEYNAGVYIMKVRTDNGEIVKRFVKK